MINAKTLAGRKSREYARIMKRNICELAVVLTALLLVFGCGGGGGGGGGGQTSTVNGRVMLVGTGQPLTGATVNIGGRSVTTTATGTFTVLNVPVTPAPQMTVTAQGVRTLTQSVPLLTPNEVNDIGDVWVVDSTGEYTAVVTGTVVSAEDFQPVAGATVTIGGQRALTGANGSFRISNLPVGLGGPDVRVGRIFKQGFPLGEFIIDPPLGPSPPDNDLGAIPLATAVGPIPGGPFNIRGTISQAGVQDMSFTTVNLIRDSDQQTVGTMTTGADGRYGFWVVAGDYTVRATRGTATGSADANLARIDQPITVNLTVAP
jgi:hypothetical protein